MIGNASESFHHPQDSQQDDEREDRGEKETENLARSQVIYYKVPVSQSLYERGERQVFSSEFQIFPKFNLLPTNLFMEKFHVPPPPQFLNSFPFYKLYGKDRLLKCRKSSAESFAITVPS